MTTQSQKTLKLFTLTNVHHEPKLIGQNVKASSVEHFVNKLINFEWLTDYIPDKILSLGNVDCISLNWKTK